MGSGEKGQPPSGGVSGEISDSQGDLGASSSSQNPGPSQNQNAPDPSGYPTRKRYPPDWDPNSGYPIAQQPPKANYPQQAYQYSVAQQPPQAGYPPQAYQYSQLPGGPPPEGYDPEANLVAFYAAEFQEKSVRTAFVRKVLVLVFLQLAFTAACGLFFYTYHPLKHYVQRNSWPFFLAWAISFVVVLTISCSNRARRHYPWNYLSLGVFTAAFGFLVGTLTSFYNIEVLVMAMGITAGVVGFIFLLTTLTDFDFTRKGAGILYIASIAFLLTLLVGMFWVNKTLYLVISLVGAVLFSAYLMFDLQTLMGGYALQISPDDYVFASVNIYLDVINIFLNILSVLNLLDSGS